MKSPSCRCSQPLTLWVLSVGASPNKCLLARPVLRSEIASCRWIRRLLCHELDVPVTLRRLRVLVPLPSAVVKEGTWRLAGVVVQEGPCRGLPVALKSNFFPRKRTQRGGDDVGATGQWRSTRITGSASPLPAPSFSSSPLCVEGSLSRQTLPRMGRCHACSGLPSHVSWWKADGCLAGRSRENRGSAWSCCAPGSFLNARPPQQPRGERAVAAEVPRNTEVPLKCRASWFT